MARFAVAALGLVLCVAVVSAQLSPVAQTVMNVMDQTQNPCNDFYEYACGGWMNSHQIPGDKSRIDRSFEVITDRNQDLLVKIVENPASGLVNKYYSACMNTSLIESDGTALLNQLLSTLKPMGSDFSGLAHNLASLFKLGMSALFEFGVEIDSSDPAHNIYSLRQGGLTLPDPSYYWDSTIYPQYVSHIATMLSLAGLPPGDAFKIATFERALSNVTVPDDQLFDPFTSFNKMSWAQLYALSPNTRFPQFVSALGLRSDVSLTLDAPAFFSGLSQALTTAGPDVVFKYMRWRMIHWMAPRLPARFVTANFQFFSGVLGGVTVPPARSKICIQATDAALPELVGRLYAEAAFPPTSKYAASVIFDSILSSFEVNSQKLDWMDPVTTGKAINKLEQILRLIGYPENPRNYTSYGPKFGDHYAQNLLVTTQDEFKRELTTAGGPSDRKKWEMSADTVNAYYSPNKNEIVFPAGIIQSPFFDPAFPDAMNYGGIGMVGGHELTHSLDSQGRDFDGTGKLVDWWAPRTSEAFQKRVDCIIEQYSQFSPLPGYFVNGNLTQGENIADAGGLKSAHSAYVNMHPDEYNQPSIVPGLTNEQLFFVGFGQTWCSKLTPAAIRQRLLTDPHSPPRFRVNGPAINLPAFSDAFKCPVGSPMNPLKRCQIW